MKRALIALALVAALVGTGCGSDSGGGSSSSAEKVAYPEGPSREFYVPGGDNLIQFYGREASAAESERASSSIEAWMRARAAGDWAEVCRYSDGATVDYAIRTASEITKRKIKDCRKAMAVVFARTERLPANTMTGPIDSLRVGEGRGYAQYHGREGRDWIVPVTHEDGEWKPATFDPIDRSK
jgi:hypothetical protein